MYVHSLDPVLVSIGPLEIRWYGLVYLLGALLAYWMLERARKKGVLDLDQKGVSDLVLWILIGMLVGARLFAVFVFNLPYYLSQPWWKVFAVWEGGMSFHGGFVGIVVAGYWFCKRRNVHWLSLADILSAPLMLVLAFGRIANFINGELWGTVSNARWCVNFKNTGGGDICRHPYQLYEAVKRFALFGWLLWLGRTMFTPGFIFWNFVFFEGLGRFMLDFFKDEVIYFGLTPGQWLSIVMVVVALTMFVKKYKDDWKKVF